jgi:hypothetical protein
MKYFSLVFYRTAAAVVTSLTKGGTYPNFTFSGWTLIPGAIADKTKTGLDADVKETMGDGTEMVRSEQVPVEVIIKDFTGANFSAIRSALINQKLDFLLLDPDQPATAYAAFGVRAYPKLDIASNEEPSITVSGTRKIGAAATNTPFQHITVT